MGEDLTMMLGYSLVNTWISDKLKTQFPSEIDENGKQKTNYALEVLSGGASFLFMSAMMEVIKREEKFIEYLFVAGETVIAVLWLRNKDWVIAQKNKLSNLKGFKALQKFKGFSSQSDPTNSFISQVQQQMSNIMQGRNSSHDVANTISASNSSQDTAIRREAHDLKFAQLNNQAFTDSLKFKMDTGSFTAADELIIKKVIGRSNFGTVPIDHQELNKIHEYMFIKDSNGKFVGLTRSMVDLLNGLGFIKSN